MYPIVPSEYSLNRWVGCRLPRNLERDLDIGPPREVQISLLTNSVLTVRGIVSGLDLDDSWLSYIETSVQTANNALDVLKDLAVKAESENVDPFIRNVLGMRTLSYFKHFKKSLYYIPLRKAEARGGKYYRRVINPSGKYTYYYDVDKYYHSKSGHLDGARANKNYLQNKVKNILINNGNVVDIKVLRPLVKKYGVESVSRVIEEGIGKGSIELKGRLLRWKEQPIGASK
jgi:hypothetical protein